MRFEILDALCVGSILKPALLLALLCGLVSCHLGATGDGDAPGRADDAPPDYKRADLPVDRRVEDLVSRMTVEEKARQLDMMWASRELFEEGDRVGWKVKEDSPARPELWKTVLGDLGAGSIHDLYSSAKMANQLQRWVIEHHRLGVPALFIEEALHGYARDNQTMFPHSINLGSTWNVELARREGEAIAAESRAGGVHMILSPVLCLARDPRWGRVEETFGEDPWLSGQIGLAYVRGAQGESLATDHTVVAEPKHFIAHGTPESGVNTSPVHAGERELRMSLFKSFEPAIREGGAMSVMAAYHELDGVPCAGSPWLLTRLLREEWGFQGFVLADLGAMQRLYNAHHVAATPRDAICMAIKAGLDMQFYDFDHATFQTSIVSAVKDGQLPMATLDRAVSRVLRVKFLLGLFENPYTDETLDGRVRRCKAHADLALDMARQSMCLLKNEGGLLPLRDDLPRIAVIGPNANALRLGDYSNAAGPRGPNLLEAIRNRVSGATEIRFDEGKDVTAAVNAARGADVAILALGESEETSGEGHDRADLGLPGNQQALLEAVAATTTPIVLVLQNGRPLTIQWAADHVPAILEAWYPGESGGIAMAETLFGDNNPAGRIPVSFPRNVGQLPVNYDHNICKVAAYIDSPGTPLFPFGHGLSYTTFRYDNARVELPAAPVGRASDGEGPGVAERIAGGAAIVVKVDIANTGAREGDEVAQLYVRQETTSVVTPNKSLKGFARIRLKPGETRTVEFRLTKEHLSIWNAEEKWVVEPGKVNALVGGSSASLTTVPFEM